MADLHEKPIEHNVDAPGQPISEKKRKKRERPDPGLSLFAFFAADAAYAAGSTVSSGT